MVAGASLHWMEWAVVLPQLSQLLTPHGLLAIMDDRQVVAWQERLLEVLAAYSINSTFRPGYDWIAQLAHEGLFRKTGTLSTEAGAYRQSVTDYVESFHARQSLARERLGGARAAEFDAKVRQIVAPYVDTEDQLTLETIAYLTWGKPVAPAGSG